MFKYILSIIILLTAQSNASLQNEKTVGIDEKAKCLALQTLLEYDPMFAYPKAPFVHPYDFIYGPGMYVKAHLIEEINSPELSKIFGLNDGNFKKVFLVTQLNDSGAGSNCFKPQRVFYNEDQPNASMNWQGTISYNLFGFDENGNNIGSNKSACDFSVHIGDYGRQTLSGNVADISNICPKDCWRIIVSNFSYNSSTFYGINVLFPSVATDKMDNATSLKAVLDVMPEKLKGTFSSFIDLNLLQLN